MAQKIEVEKKKALTPEFRVAFPRVFKPSEAKAGFDSKYSVVMLFPKNTDLKELKRAAFNAATEKWGAKEKWPKNLKLPFRDGDEKADLSGYAGHIFINATSKDRPGVVDQKRAPITETDGAFYAGCYARATVIAFAYDNMGNKGVSFALQNLQKLRDGEQFSGRRRAEDEFDEVDDGSDKADNYETEEELDF